MSASADGDPGEGLSAERTALAWQRTGVNGTALAGAALVAAAHRDSAPLLSAAAAVVGGCALLTVLSGVRHGAPVLAPWWRLLAVAAMPILLAALGLTLALSP